MQSEDPIREYGEVVLYVAMIVCLVESAVAAWLAGACAEKSLANPWFALATGSIALGGSGAFLSARLAWLVSRAVGSPVVQAEGFPSVTQLPEGTYWRESLTPVLHGEIAVLWRREDGATVVARVPPGDLLPKVFTIGADGHSTPSRQDSLRETDEGNVH